MISSSAIACTLGAPSYITDVFGLDSDWQIERSTMTVDQQEVIIDLAPSVEAYQVSPDTIHYCHLHHRPRRQLKPSAPSVDSQNQVLSLSNTFLASMLSNGSSTRQL